MAMRSSVTYGYIRVSTALQKDDRQWLAMAEFGIAREFIFADKQSGKDFDRPAYQDLLGRLSAGDVLVVNIKTPHLIQSQTRVQTSKVLATRTFEVCTLVWLTLRLPGRVAWRITLSNGVCV